MNESFESAFVTSLIGERIAGRYVIERVLAAGGMGIVVVGRYPELEQEVAIKFVKPEYAANSTVCARFLREARLAARVKSPHFVRVFDFGRLDPGVPYLVMELLAGHDLTDELNAVGALPVGAAVDYLLQAMVGLAEVHGLGVVHRDLKPSNLFLAEAAGTRMVKVLDFGVSKEAVSESLTNTGTAVGTPLYMSPEQVRESRNVDVRSDIWALGVILFELVTNCLPFGNDGAPIGELYGLILHTDPVPPRHFLADLSPDIEAVILKCLKRNPDDRYANVGELAEALRPFAETAARIDAIKTILASTKPLERVEISSEDSGPMQAAKKFPVSTGRKESRPISGGAVKASSAETTDDLFGSSPRGPAGPAASPPNAGNKEKERRPTTMTATRPSELPEVPAARPKNGATSIVKVGGIALVAGIAIALFALVARRSPTPGAASEAHVAVTSLAPVPSVPSPALSVSVAPAPVVPAPSAIPSAQASAAPAPSASTTAVPPSPPARARPPRRTLGPGKASTPPEDLLDDRK